MTLYRRIRLAFYLTLAVILLDIGEPLLWALLGSAYIGWSAYAAGDAWLCERERRATPPSSQPLP